MSCITIETVSEKTKKNVYSLDIHDRNGLWRPTISPIAFDRTDTKCLSTLVLCYSFVPLSFRFKACTHKYKPLEHTPSPGSLSFSHMLRNERSIHIHFTLAWRIFVYDAGTHSSIEQRLLCSTKDRNNVVFVKNTQRKHMHFSNFLSPQTEHRLVIDVVFVLLR